MTTNKALEVAREIAEECLYINGMDDPEMDLPKAEAIIDQALQSERELADKLAQALQEYTGVVVSVNEPDSFDVKVADGGEPAREALAAYSAHRGVKA